MRDLLPLLRTFPDGERAVEALVQALQHVIYHDDDPANRALAAAYLGDIGGEAVLPALLHALDDTAPAVSDAAVQAFLQLDHPEAAQHIARLLRHEDGAVRHRALAVVLQHGWQHNIQPRDVYHLLEDDDPGVRTQAVRVLGAVGTDADAPVLMRALRDPDSRVGLAAAKALGRLQNPAASKALFDVALDLTSYYRMREAALTAIVQIDAPHMNDMLFDLLSQNNPELDLYHTVVSSISRIETEAQVKLLLDAADWHSSLVRPVRDALVRAGGRAVEAVMIRSLAHVREWIRSLAVEVLGELRCTRCVNAMLPLLQDDVQSVRLLTANALGQIGDTRAVPHLKYALRHDEWLVQAAAASALARIDARDTSIDLEIDEEDPPDVDLSDLS